MPLLRRVDALDEARVARAALGAWVGQVDDVVSDEDARNQAPPDGSSPSSPAFTSGGTRIGFRFGPIHTAWTLALVTT